MRLRAGLLATGLLLSLAVGAVVTAPGEAASPNRLRAFDGCPSFLEYVRSRSLPLVGPYGIGNTLGARLALPPGAARDAVAGTAPADADFSGTNVQEEGVDEPDIAKSNGRTLFVVSGGRLSAVDVRSPRPRLLGSLRLSGDGARELLLHGSRVLVLSQSITAFPSEGRVGIRAPWPYPATSTIAEVDVRDPARMRLVRTMELDGGYLTARLVGRTARIVLSSPLVSDLPFVQPSGPAPDAAARAKAQNRELVRTAPARRWLPGFRIRAASGAVGREGRLVQCRNVRRPPWFSGLGLLTVLTVDVERGLDPVDADAVLSDGRVVYASRSSLYVATERWDPRLAEGRPVPGDPVTAIHRFDIAGPGETHYRSSGSVPGVLLGQWSLSEHDGVLRVASTEQPVWWGGPRAESETAVTTLREQAGALVRVGRVGGLGKGERVYAVRFSGEVGYVVTFRQVDPLYTLDLSSPARPAVRGELKLRGYSAYLHPVGDGLLLGIGQDATDEGRVLGVQASLFDVSDVRRPRRLDAFALGRSWSAVEQDHRAFLWWPRTRLAVIPLVTTDAASAPGALGLRVGRTLTEAGRVTHPALGTSRATEPQGAPILRSLVVRDTLYTVSESGVQASSLATFADVGFVRF